MAARSWDVHAPGYDGGTSGYRLADDVFSEQRHRPMAGRYLSRHEVEGLKRRLREGSAEDMTAAAAQARRRGWPASLVRAVFGPDGEGPAT